MIEAALNAGIGGARSVGSHVQFTFLVRILYYCIRVHGFFSAISVANALSQLRVMLSLLYSQTLGNTERTTSAEVTPGTCRRRERRLAISWGRAAGEALRSWITLTGIAYWMTQSLKLTLLSLTRVRTLTN